MEAYYVILNEFLNRWTLANVQNMTLEQYVDVGNGDTFCQWVETRTYSLGSIKGLTSIKFGIYKRADNIKQPKNYINDNEYSWAKSYGGDRNAAFTIVKTNILQVIKCAIEGNFSAIDNIELLDIFKWKIAYLYSNERLIPLFTKELLTYSATSFGMNITKDTAVSEIQAYLIEHKPLGLNSHDFAQQLFNQFGSQTPLSSNHSTSSGSITSISSNNQQKNIQNSKGNRKGGSFIITYQHNKIQNKLYEQLKAEFGDKNVELEKDYIDIKVTHKDYIALYEVKVGDSATQCLRQATGQLLEYAFKINSKLPVKLFVVGQYELSQNEKEYLKFLKTKLGTEFDYIAVSIAH